MFGDRRPHYGYNAASTMATGSGNEGIMAFQSENYGTHVNPPRMRAADLKAMLERSSAKKPEAARSAFKRDENRIRSMGTMTPGTQAHVETVLEKTIRRAVETQSRVVRALCNQNCFTEAREALGGLRRLAPEVIELAEFWEAVMMVEKQDNRRAAMCLAFAIENVRRQSEKEQLMTLISDFLKTQGASDKPESVDEFLFDATRRLSFKLNSTSPQRAPSSVLDTVASYEDAGDVYEPEPTEVSSPQTNEKRRTVTFTSEPTEEITIPARGSDFSGSFSLKPLLEELTSPGEQATVHFETTEEMSPGERPAIQFRRTPHPARTLNAPLSASSSVFSSPAVRIAAVLNDDDDEMDFERPSALLQSRSPARNRMFATESDDEPKGSVVVLSPVREPGSGKRLATPVRRSLRTSTVSVSEKNQDALQRSEFSYAPNPSLNPAPITLSDSPLTSSPCRSAAKAGEDVRRSARKVKSVEKLSPRFGRRTYEQQ